ncbi:tyrosine-type recombinase/integrase [Mycobacteroides abscessus]|uniref:tyrosine-type recombinase/integrase n=1 Tax=Mycobacteroides abscessus TaxID=36809 RepID=UPI0009A9111A|nr:tyrosine-type recombinase/integrase [Mycobacteroides abscessus]SKT96139.1 integrase [Mycobacteroides abscessus subsp. massiliense]SKU13815.1 integrase [Mycobacteroides abscessus subsp. massiliense]
MTTARQKSGPAPLPVPTGWNHLIEGYRQHQQAAGRPATTIATRLSHITRIARALDMPANRVAGKALKAWFATQTQWSIETRRGYRNSARSFFGWAHNEGLIDTNPSIDLPHVTAPVPLPKPAPDRVWKESLFAADARTTVMLHLACGAGMRRAEVAQVHTSDLIESFDGYQLIVHGKGNKKRVIPITDEIAAMIQRGAAGHTPGCSPTGWLFPGDNNGHLSARWVGTLCSKAMPEVWTMHKLRHRFATRAYRATRNIRAVQKLLGHASVATTQIYTAVDDHEMRAAVEGASGTGAQPSWHSAA